MVVGPVEVVVVKFPGSKFNGEIGPALADTVENGDVRILDLVFVIRESEDEYEVIELDDIGDDGIDDLNDGAGSPGSLLSDEDLDNISDQLEVGSSAVAIEIEPAWATRLASAVRDSKGEIVLQQRIPAEVVEAVLLLAREED